MRNITQSRKTMIIAASVLLIILIPIISTSYFFINQNAWTQVIYSSPEGGDTIMIGDWLYDDFRGPNVPTAIDYHIGCQGTILSGGGGSGYIYFNFEYERMTLMEYLNLNTTEHEGIFGSGISGSSNILGHFDSGWGGPIHNYDYVWAFRFLNVSGQTSGEIRMSLTVSLQVF